MSEFFRYVGEKLSEYPVVYLSRTIEKSVQDLAVEKLQVRDIGQLRDRFEGQAYMDNHLLRIGSYLAVLNHLGIKAPEFSTELFALDMSLTIDGVDYNIIACKSGELPVLEKTQLNKPALFVIQKLPTAYSIAGVATLDVLSKKENVKATGIEKFHFCGFNDLAQIKTN